ncbi:hypothetical protein SPSYN_01931 [Sporotomaculum syntrophicum]|uniref:DUF368 domain-containing protein n=2 Tax=Sporotomaculum syntrophicum TaxID=182264 RepID=A0A9D3AXS6_9FIRM|nr:hypothetical protein SPSYN_01931 [Sporotomaculum syntrophicum]
MNSTAAWIVLLFKGMLIGIGAILPGLSGGVLAVIFGIYDQLIAFLANIRKNFIQNMKFFLPIGIGAVFGIFLFSIAVKAAFGKYEAQFVCLFIGFVIGTLPSLYRKAGAFGRAIRQNVILAVAAVAIFSLMMIGNSLPDIQPNTPVWFFSGAFVALGFIVPGLSTSNFLIYFGLYDKMAEAISLIDFFMLIPFGIGAVLCILLFAKFAFWLFKMYYADMYHLIVGLVIGSSLAIFPAIVFPSFTDAGLAMLELSFTQAAVFSVIMLVAGIALSYAFSKLEDRYPTD